MKVSRPSSRRRPPRRATTSPRTWPITPSTGCVPRRRLVPDKPFFMYFAPGATHAPHHVPQEWADKYKGQFAHGWDRQRELTFARQQELGVIAPDAKLTARHAEIPAWDEMPEELRPILEREMEVYAGFLEHTDHHVGRVVDAIEQLGILDNTLIYYIIGDNGASAEGTINGAFNEMANFNGMAALETPEFLLSKLYELGSPTSYNHYAVGWAWAMDTPYQWTKQVASHWGGTRNGTIVHWPGGITEQGGHRSQFCHVIDVAPTILEAAGIPEPLSVNGVQQVAHRGDQHALQPERCRRPRAARPPVLRDVRQPRHLLQGLECRHQAPDPVGDGGVKLAAFDDDIWELYDGSKDWTQADDLSAELPEKLRELQRLWLIEAVKYNVLPH